MTEKEIREAIRDLEELKREMKSSALQSKACSISKAIYALEKLIESNRD